MIPATTTICYVGDDLYLAPYYGNVTVLLYNKANVEAAGYTGDTILSLEDMLAICEKAKADGKLGFIYRGDSQNNLVVDFLPILLSYGGWVIDEQQSAHRQYSRVQGRYELLSEAHRYRFRPGQG